MTTFFLWSHKNCHHVSVFACLLLCVSTLYVATNSLANQYLLITVDQMTTKNVNGAAHNDKHPTLMFHLALQIVLRSFGEFFFCFYGPELHCFGYINAGLIMY